MQYVARGMGEFLQRETKLFFALVIGGAPKTHDPVKKKGLQTTSGDLHLLFLGPASKYTSFD